MKIAIFANTGNWDIHSIGFVGSIDVGSVNEIGVMLNGFVYNDLAGDVGPVDVVSVFPGSDVLEELSDEHELSTYFEYDTDKTVFCSVIDSDEDVPYIYIAVPI